MMQKGLDGIVFNGDLQHFRRCLPFQARRKKYVMTLFVQEIQKKENLRDSMTENLEDSKRKKIVYYSTGNLLDEPVNQMVSGENEIFY